MTTLLLAALLAAPATPAAAPAAATKAPAAERVVYDVPARLTRTELEGGVEVVTIEIDVDFTLEPLDDGRYRWTRGQMQVVDADIPGEELTAAEMDLLLVQIDEQLSMAVKPLEGVEAEVAFDAGRPSVRDPEAVRSVIHDTIDSLIESGLFGRADAQAEQAIRAGVTEMFSSDEMLDAALLKELSMAMAYLPHADAAVGRQRASVPVVIDVLGFLDAEATVDVSEDDGVRVITVSYDAPDVGARLDETVARMLEGMGIEPGMAGYGEAAAGMRQAFGQSIPTGGEIVTTLDPETGLPVRVVSTRRLGSDLVGSVETSEFDFEPRGE